MKVHCEIQDSHSYKKQGLLLDLVKLQENPPKLYAWVTFITLQAKSETLQCSPGWLLTLLSGEMTACLYR